MIGVFDSGLGGLTVVRELMRQLPGYGFVYFGDTARLPYGTKGPKTVRKFAIQDAEFLVSKGAKAIIIACNTASAQAYDEVRAKLSVPVFEVVSPAVERAAVLIKKRGAKGRVGVIGTRGTIASGIYARKMAEAAPKAELFAQACPLFVPLVEEDWLRRPETAAIANTYLRPLRLRRLDTLILGCTHYPFLKPVIAKAMPGVRLVDPAKETIARFAAYLKDHPALDRQLRTSQRQAFYVSDRTEHFERLAARWLGRPVSLQTVSLG